MEMVQYCSRVEDLPDEVLVEILLRLPLLSAHQSKLVSKRWYALLSSPFYAQLFGRKPKIFSILIGNNTIVENEVPLFSIGSYQFTEFKSMRGFSLRFLPQSGDEGRPCFLASCNDLLLCRLNPKKQGGCCFVLCNPITEKWVQLPSPPTPSNPHPTLQYKANGLLCDSSTGRYAVVRITNPVSYCDFADHERSEIELQVFTSDTCEWSQKTIPYHPRVRSIEYERTGATPYNGMLFWLFCSPKFDTDGLIAIDPFNSWKPPSFFDMPRGFSPKSHESDAEALGVCAGNLRLFQASRHVNSVDGLCISVWDLKLYDSKDNSTTSTSFYEWVLYREVDFQDIPYPFPKPLAVDGLFFSNPLVLNCHPDNSNVVYVLIGKRVVSCNLLEQHFEVVCESPLFRCHPYFTCTITIPWQPTQLPPPLPVTRMDNLRI